MNRAPANKENVIPLPARYPCQKDIGMRPGKRKAETNLGVSQVSARSASHRKSPNLHQTKDFYYTDTMDEGERSPQAPESWHQAGSATDSTTKWCTVSMVTRLLVLFLHCSDNGMFLWQGGNLLCRHWRHHQTGTAFHLQQQVRLPHRSPVLSMPHQCAVLLSRRPEPQTSSVRTFADITTKTANVAAQEPHIDSSSRV